MKRECLTLVIVLIVGAVAWAQPAAPDQKTNAAITRAREALDTRIETAGLQDGMPFAKLLVELEARLPKEKRVTLTIDAMAIGQDQRRLTEMPVALPAVPKALSLGTALRIALAQCAVTEAKYRLALGPMLGVGASQRTSLELDYDILPTGVTITHPRRGARTVVYDISNLIPLIARLRGSAVAGRHPNLFRDIPAADGAAWLTRWLASEVELEAWESVGVANGTRFTVFASPHHHRAIRAALERLPRLEDVAVVMNARLYEVDGAFFRKHVAPSFIAASDSKHCPTILPIDGKLLKKIAAQRLVLESDDVKLAPDQHAGFLSLQHMVRYDTTPVLGQREPMPIRTTLVGVSFTVRPRVSPDGHFLKLRITQHVNRLVAIDKGKRLDIITGKHEELAVPNLQALSVAGTVVLADGDPFLMPVDYQPPGKGGEDKVWLLVARPRIWIQAEEDERKAGKAPADSFVWHIVPVKEETPAPPALPLTDDVRDILQGVITEVLTSPRMQFWREFYGTPKDMNLELLAGDKLGWPKQFNPRLHRYRIVKTLANPFGHPHRILGIRLDDFDLKPKANPTEATIAISLIDAGGIGGVIGAANISYSAWRVGERWAVTFEMLSAP